MVCTFLELEEIERADASDALAVALCHLNQSRAGVPVAAGKVPRSRRKSGQAQLADRLVPSYRRPEAR
jgi:crossover junction endodeoxyribonuclease RuvC